MITIPLMTEVAKNTILDSAEEGFKSVLNSMSFDYVNDPNMVDTPRRIAKAWFEMCRGAYNTVEQIDAVMRPLFPCLEFDEMVVVRNIETIGICPHHFLPVTYNSTLAYLPAVDGKNFGKDCNTGKVLGLSKLPRLVDILSARPVLQEKLVVDVVSVLEEYLHPAGVGFTLVGAHGCMQCRGIKLRDADTVTTKLTGAIKSELAVRSEYMSYLGSILNR